MFCWENTEKYVNATPQTSSFPQSDSTEPSKKSLGKAKKHVKEPEVFPWPPHSPDTNQMGSDSICGKKAQHTKTLNTTNKA